MVECGFQSVPGEKYRAEDRTQTGHKAVPPAQTEDRQDTCCDLEEHST